MTCLRTRRWGSLPASYGPFFFASLNASTALHRPGGVLVYGIPRFSLPIDVIDNEIEILKKMGVEIICNAVIGKTLTIDDLFAEGFDAVLIGTGAGLPYFMNIPGENLCGIYSANEFSTRVNLMPQAGGAPDRFRVQTSSKRWTP